MTQRSLRIAIATVGRFHVLDLARELDALGHQVRFHSYLPRARAEAFGLPRRCHRGFLAAAAPALAWERLAPRLAPGAREGLLFALANAAVTRALEPCDVFICMSGVYLEAAQAARRRFGARIWLERGSRHILSQDRILAGIPGAARPSRRAIRRELAGYALADRIVVPSEHVEKSFHAEDPAAAAKTFRNPYGADLAMFPPRAARRGDGPFTLVFAGGWSLRKGCDVLEAAVRAAGDIRLVHVGPVVDRPFPSGDPRFVHRGPVPQPQLTDVYAEADALVLPSREEGLSLVLPQALATGLPLICSDRTGGADLGHTAALAQRICVMPAEDAAALAAAIVQLRARLAGAPPEPLLDADRQTLSWAAYGRRYSDELLRDLH